jgi:hypothetical protein
MISDTENPVVSVRVVLDAVFVSLRGGINRTGISWTRGAMNFRHVFRTVRGIAVLIAGLVGVALPFTLTAQRLRDSAQPAGRWRDVSMEEYRSHLVVLKELTVACANARDVKRCDPTLVGPDDRIPIASGAETERRVVRYGWLRVLLYKADEPDKAEDTAGVKGQNLKQNDNVDASPRPAPRTTSQLLQDAEMRLTQDLAQAGAPSAGEPAHSGERYTMKQVLAEREFRNLQQAPETDTVMEKVGNWLNHMFAGFTRLRARSAWVGRALVWAFFLAVAALLGWRLMRMERRWKSRLAAPRREVAPEAASARDWQLWLADARAAAAAGCWREAIHFVYWASISRLESRRLWPADRARTPREYLVLMAPEDPRRPALATLTGSFERTWYGGRAADETEYRQAEQVAAGLMGGGWSEGEAL